MKAPTCGGPEQPLSVGQVAQRSGLPVSTLHFYEARGLIHSQRNAGNQRRYRRSVLRRVAIIKVAQRLGIPMAEIGAALSSLPDGQTPCTQDWQRLSAKWQQDLNERIEKLTRLRDHLTGCIGCGCLSTELCPLRNPADTLACRGPGAHLLEDD